MSADRDCTKHYGPRADTRVCTDGSGFVLEESTVAGKWHKAGHYADRLTAIGAARRDAGLDASYEEPPATVRFPSVAPKYEHGPSRYVHGMIAVRFHDSHGGFKGSVTTLATQMGARWHRREQAYLMSPAKFRDFSSEYASMWGST